MKNKWRIPSIMDLSQLLVLEELTYFQQVWTNLEQFPYPDYPGYRWTGTRDGKGMRRYELNRTEKLLVCILVQTENNYLNWCDPFKNKTYADAERLCEEVNWSSRSLQPLFITPRAEIFNER